MTSCTTRLASLALFLLLGAGGACLAEDAAPTGKLHVTVELQGSARNNARNGVEWAALSTRRTMSLDLAMWMPEAGGGPLLTLGGVDAGQPLLPPGAEAIANAVAACGGDQACVMKAAMALGEQLQADENALGSLDVDTTRYQNWLADSSGMCASGEAIVADTGNGMAIDPPHPAAPYYFERRGQGTISAEGPGTRTYEDLCDSILTVDTEQGLASLRLPGHGIYIPVQMSGQAFTKEKQVEFLEGTQRIELTDQRIDAGSKTWGGEVAVARLGSVSHNSGDVVAPVSARITWEFVRD